MTCAEFREIVGLFVAGGLDAREREAAEAHLREPRHEGCLEALREANAGAEVLARSLPPARPDARVWQRIERQLGAQARPLAMGWRERASWVVATAAALLLFAALSGRRQSERAHRQAMAGAESQRVQCLAELESAKSEGQAQRAALELLQSPTAQVFALAPQPGKPAYAVRAIVDLPRKRGMIVSSTLSPQAGKDYQLWVIRGKEPPAPAGLLRAGSSGTVLASIDQRLLAVPPDALAVSVEAQGGSVSGKPSADIVLVGALPRT